MMSATSNVNVSLLSSAQQRPGVQFGLVFQVQSRAIHSHTDGLVAAQCHDAGELPSVQHLHSRAKYGRILCVGGGIIRS